MVDQAQKAWSGMDFALRTAMREVKRLISRSLPASLGFFRVRGRRVQCFLNYPEDLFALANNVEAVAD